MSLQETIKGFFSKAKEQKKVTEPVIIDAQGRHCPPSSFSEVKLARTAMIDELVMKSSEFEKAREAFHAEQIQMIEAYFIYCAEHYKTQPLDSSDGVSMTNISGLRKITIDKTMAAITNENVAMAKKELDAMLEKHGEGVDPFFKEMAYKAFGVSAKGQMRVDKILEFRTMQCPYPEWGKIKTLLDEAVAFVFKKRYLRIQTRDSVKDSWTQINF